MVAALLKHQKERVIETSEERGWVDLQEEKKGRTALMLAAMEGKEEIVRLLVGTTGQADVNVKDKKGRTALALAEEKEKTEVVALLSSSS